MKFRNGFVSNSSSSSFVVVFPKHPESFEDVFEMMFKSQVEDIDPFDFNEPITTVEAAKQVWEDIQAQMNGLPISRQRIASEMYNEVYWQVRKTTVPDPWARDISEEERDRRQKVLDEAIVKAADQRTEEFLQANQGGMVCMFEYADDDGTFGSCMEHGEIFFRLPHVQISKH